MKFFSRLYVRFLTWVATVLANALSNTMRRLCVAQGKDPDYQPPAPLPKEDPIPTQDEIAVKLDKFYSSSSPRTSAMKDGNWVKDLSSHPVLKHRASFESKKHLHVVGSEPQPPELTPQEAEEILQLVTPTDHQDAWSEAVKAVANEKK